MPRTKAAELFKCSAAYVSQIVRGRRIPSVPQLVVIGDSLRMSDAALGAACRELAATPEPIVADELGHTQPVEA